MYSSPKTFTLTSKHIWAVSYHIRCALCMCVDQCFYVNKKKSFINFLKVENSGGANFQWRDKKKDERRSPFIFQQFKKSWF